MIEFLQGVLAAKSPTAAVVQVGGVAFMVQIPTSTYEALPREGAEARVLTHLQVREDQVSLYGFATEEERTLFRMLQGVSRVGPAVALRVLSSCSVAQFRRYVLDEDADALRSMVKGIGTKTARRLILELQGRMQDMVVSEAGPPEGQASRDAVRALVALGESRTAAEKAVKAASDKLGPDAETEALLAAALSR